jgi:hypothetical protein
LESASNSGPRERGDRAIKKVGTKVKAPCPREVAVKIFWVTNAGG